jgi:segregation and condensation protein B
MTVDPQTIRMVEALLFAAVEPLDEATLIARLPDGADVAGALQTLAEHYSGRGVHLNKVAGRWSFRTAPDLAALLEEHKDVARRLSRAAVETLAIIAYHQPVTRAEIEEIRGVSISKGTLDVLLEAGWVRLRGRRRTPGRPVTYGTSDDFLIHFGLSSLEDLPGLQELKAAGMLDSQPKPSLFPVASSDDEEEPEDEDDADTETDAGDDEGEEETLETLEEDEEGAALDEVVQTETHQERDDRQAAGD